MVFLSDIGLVIYLGVHAEAWQCFVVFGSTVIASLLVSLLIRVLAPGPSRTVTSLTNASNVASFTNLPERMVLGVVSFLRQDDRLSLATANTFTLGCVEKYCQQVMSKILREHRVDSRDAYYARIDACFPQCEAENKNPPWRCRLAAAVNTHLFSFGQPELTIRKYGLERGVHISPVLSPSNKYILLAIKDDNTTVLVLVDLETHEEIWEHVFRDIGYYDTLYSFFWGENDNIGVFTNGGTQFFVRDQESYRLQHIRQLPPTIADEVVHIEPMLFQGKLLVCIDFYTEQPMNITTLHIPSFLEERSQSLFIDPSKSYVDPLINMNDRYVMFVVFMEDTKTMLLVHSNDQANFLYLVATLELPRDYYYITQDDHDPFVIVARPRRGTGLRLRAYRFDPNAQEFHILPGFGQRPRCRKYEILGSVLSKQKQTMYACVKYLSDLSHNATCATFLIEEPLLGDDVDS